MLKGNKLALYQGYTYYKMKKNKKWYCTSYPICDCYIELNSNMCGSGHCTDGPECALPEKGTGAVSSSRQSAAATSRARPWFIQATIDVGLCDEFGCLIGLPSPGRHGPVSAARVVQRVGLSH
ncbi:hypothetical protein B5X24_HaOG207890 [Helicoverpa armigera]|uniref:Uncharacterized protein n=1 Tax=Helicoverpa armigera TaxID=29058 RepID=A0A2W1BRN0_HELAM|nr:hypothetical protein B5X24_HaOG207890 [Helicoverpa armigera]